MGNLYKSFCKDSKRTAETVSIVELIDTHVKMSTNWNVLLVKEPKDIYRALDLLS